LIRNPILRGFNPDPSILRVGEDYYIATSTFVWQPGIRLFHSRDLGSWTLVGHALHGVHDLRGVPSHGGIWAPSLSRDPASGRFHLTYSLVRSTAAGYFDVDNFVVSAMGIAGPWSEPAYLNSVGFDPSLFHDDDGRHWLVTLEWDPRDGYEHPGAIVLEEYDSQTRRLRGGTRRIYRGATDRGCLEGPHLYKKDGWYYLLAAEGGTGFGHGVTLARARNIFGPYEAAPVNPILTSNPAPHFGRDDRDHLRPGLFNPGAELQKAGHGSLVDTPSGEWYMAYLCARPLGSGHWSVLGRETAIQRVEWTDDGWLRLSGGGTLARATTPAPRGTAPFGVTSEHVRDGFDEPEIDPRFSTLRRRFSDDWVAVNSGPGSLSLRGGDMLTSRFDVSIVATQLQDFTAVADTRVRLQPRHLSHSAGLVMLYDEGNFAYLRLYRSESLGRNAVGVLLLRDGVKRELLLDRAAVAGDEVVMQARIDHGALQFLWGASLDDLKPIGPVLDTTYMSDEATRGFTGTMIGMACVDANRKDLVAHFDWFDLRHGPDVPADDHVHNSGPSPRASTPVRPHFPPPAERTTTSAPPAEPQNFDTYLEGTGRTRRGADQSFAERMIGE
jgi:xylan 1,4-beta-xylosidase